MARMTKEQSENFERLWAESIDWGNEDECGMCNGLFSEFGENLEMLSTGVHESTNTLELYWCPSIYEVRGIGSVAMNSKGKAIFKKVVTHLMTNDFKSLVAKNRC